ncbi:hypothetical protein BH20ACT5_BH20ACT5_22120 [soil metagenome]
MSIRPWVSRIDIRCPRFARPHPGCSQSRAPRASPREGRGSSSCPASKLGSCRGDNRAGWAIGPSHQPARVPACLPFAPPERIRADRMWIRRATRHRREQPSPAGVAAAADVPADRGRRWHLLTARTPIPRGRRAPTRPPQRCAEPGRGRRGHRRYRDVRYRRFRVVVELDGRAAHPEDDRERDDLRDNELAERGEQTLRYRWRSVTGRRCQVALQVAGLLARNGWAGVPTPCGEGCPVGSAYGRLSAAG